MQELGKGVIISVIAYSIIIGIWAGVLQTQVYNIQTEQLKQEQEYRLADTKIIETQDDLEEDYEAGLKEVNKQLNDIAVILGKLGERMGITSE